MSTIKRIDRLGVYKTAEYFARYGWLFREQSSEDYGIDAQVEVADDNGATGALIGIQIKSGTAYFKEQKNLSIVFRSNDRHIQYWIQHMLPVIVVLYDDTTGELFWENVSVKTIKSTGKGWRIDIPKKNRLSEDSLIELKALTQPPPYNQRLNKLRLDRTWIDLVSEGEVVFVEFDDWVNKSLPRFAIKIGCDSRDDVAQQEWPMTYGQGLSYEELLSHLLPWADFRMDHEAYEEFMRDKWMADCYSWYDKETDKIYYTRSFEEYYTPPEGISPISDNGETEGYRLILSLNEIGNAFLILDEYLREEDDLEARTFTV